MAKKPEELIILSITIAWVILTFLINLFLKINLEVTINITVSTTLLVMLNYIAWKNNKIHYLWPIFLGMLVICWWPYLTWIAINNENLHNEYIIIENKWYNTLKFKLIISILPIVIGYIIILYNKKYKKKG